MSYVSDSLRSVCSACKVRQGSECEDITTVKIIMIMVINDDKGDDDDDADDGNGDDDNGGDDDDHDNVGTMYV